MSLSATADPVPFGAVRDAVVDGQRLRYLDVGHGPVVLLVHGLGGSWQNWSENVTALSAAHRVIAVDLPGFGASAPLAEPGDADRYVELLAALLTEVGVTEVVVAGHSLGGLVATMFAEAHPDRTRGLVLVSAGSVMLGRARLAMIGVGFGVFDAVVRRTPLLDLVSRHERLRWLFLRGAVRRPATLRPDLALEVIPAMRAPGFADAVVAGVAVLREAHPVAVRCPTLLVWGRDDRLVPLSSAHALRTLIPDTRLAVLDDVGHCAMFEWPDAFDRIVLDFLAEIEGDDDPLDDAAPGQGRELRPVAWYARPRRTGLAVLAHRLAGGATARLGTLTRLVSSRATPTLPTLHRGA